jgi:hypothetical protein
MTFFSSAGVFGLMVVMGELMKDGA